MTEQELKQLNYQQLKKLVTDKGHVFFNAGNYNLNFIWLRLSDKITNYFTDVLHVAYKENNVEKVLSLPATTKPGIKGSIDSPITYEGVTGTAIICPGQYRASWSFIDSYYEFSKYPYFRQVKGINYWRDGDKDLLVDEIQEQSSKLFGTHWHRMSNKGATGFPINNWSLGCCGSEEPYFCKLLPITREAVKKWGNLFTGTFISTYK